MKSFKTLACISMLLMLITSCASSNSSTPLGQICNVYAEIAENKQEWTNAFQEVYTAPRDQQEALQKKAETIAQECQERNKQLAEQAKTLGAELQGTTIPCAVDPSLGFKLEQLEFANVNATENLCNIMLKGNVADATPGMVYVFMLNEDGDVLEKVRGSLADGSVRINFRITTDKGPAAAQAYGAVTSLKIVTESEFMTGKAPSAAEDASDPQELEEPTPDDEPEPAYAGNDSENNAAASVIVDGVTIRQGAPLVETLRKLKKITWDYNADFGVIATVGNVWITIDESDLTKKGQDIINAIPSDMENNIAFSVDYIKTSAKISRFEAQ